MIAGIIWAALHYVYGVYRMNDISMSPSLKDGDLVFFYRMQKELKAGDIVIFEDETGRLTAERVIAVTGDEVDIDETGLKLNGSYQHEPSITSKTYRFESEVSFPVKPGEGEVFVLGDNREHAKDSRMFGCVGKSAVKGKLIGLFRRRNF